LADTEFLDKLRSYNGVPAAVLENQQLVDLLLPMVRADFTAYETYAYSAEPPFEFPISVFGGVRDPWVRHERIDAWRHQTAGPFSMKMIAGDHFFIQTARGPLVEQVTRDIRQRVRAPSWV
jgi:medium-chain acyl-[acyl-carrier-protein] hydrolase